jgi:hypothetical protein
VDRGLYNGADRHFLWLWDNIPHGEALDLLLTVAIPKNIARRSLLHLPDVHVARPRLAGTRATRGS